MAKYDEIPDPPPPASPLGSSVYLGNIDDEARQINRRVSPIGKALIFLIIAALGVTGYFLYRTYKTQQSVEQAKNQGMDAFKKAVDENIPAADKAKKIQEIYAKYKVAVEVRMAVRNKLSMMHDASAVSIILDGLGKDANMHERRQAALCLIELAPDLSDDAKAKARTALLDAIDRADPKIDRAEIAWALVVFQEPKAWDKVLPLLKDNTLQRVKDLREQEAFDPTLVARLAGPDRLIKLAEDPSIPVKRIAANALAEIADATVYDALAKLSGDADPEVAREATIGAVRTGNEAASALVVKLVEAHPDTAQAVLDALTRVSGAPGLSLVIRSIPKLETRAQAVKLLSELMDPDGGDALAFALEQIQVDPTWDKEKDKAKIEQVNRARDDAMFGLANIGDPRAADPLLRVAEDFKTEKIDLTELNRAKKAMERMINIPGAAAKYKDRVLLLLDKLGLESYAMFALASTEDPTVGPIVMQKKYLENEDFLEGIAITVCRTKYEPGIKWVQDKMKRPANHPMSQYDDDDQKLVQQRIMAIHAIIWTRDARFAPDLEVIVEDKDDWGEIRAEAALALAAIADEAAFQRIMAKIVDPARDIAERINYVYGLRIRSNPEISAKLMTEVFKPGVDNALLRSVAEAVGLGGDASLAPLLKPYLASTDSNVRNNAVIAAILSGAVEDFAEIDAAFKSDPELAGIMKQYFTPQAAAGGSADKSMEPDTLKPLTDAMFQDGRIYRRADMALRLRRADEQTRSFVANWLRTRLTVGWESHPLGLHPFQVRTKVRDAAKGDRAEWHDISLQVLRLISDRGSLLWLRRQPGAVGERARVFLLQMNRGGAQ